jgi:hypothetical protein
VISPKGKQDEFVAAMKGRDLKSIVKAARLEKRDAVGARGVDSRYVEVLNGICGILEYRMKPSSVRAWELAGMRSIIEDLIERGELPHEMLAIFATADR